MVTVGAFDAKTHLSSLLKKVEQGEEVLITRRGKTGCEARSGRRGRPPGCR